MTTLAIKKDSNCVHKGEEDASLDEPFSTASANRDLNKLEQEFRDMLLDFSQFTRREIRGMKDPKMKALFEGVAASYSLPEVYRAFEVMFVDFVPFRIAARLIYGKLRNVVIQSQSERQREVHEVVSCTDMSHDQVDANRAAYINFVIHVGEKYDAGLSIQQLVDAGIAQTVAEVLGYNHVDEFLTALGRSTSINDKISFCELMTGLQSCGTGISLAECNAATALPEVARRLTQRQLGEVGDVHDCETSQIKPLSQKKQRFVKRYDYMVRKFMEWEDFVPRGEGRRLDVLRGCFVGAESPPIVNALRIVYVDYYALRLSGDLIFNLMSAIIGAAATKRGVSSSKSR